MNYEPEPDNDERREERHSDTGGTLPPGPYLV